MEGVIGILLSLGLLMFLAYRGISVIILAPVLAMLAVVLAGEGGQMLGIYTQVFMTKMGGFAIKYFPIFLLGAIFGKLMEDSGCAKVIAKSIISSLGIKHAALAIVLACGLLTYGGVSAFVVAFAVYPLGAALFREANLPKRFIPATIALGAFTFTMTCLPGTSQIHNIIPVSYFGTDMYAAPIIGITAGMAMMLGGLSWINFRINQSHAEGYGEDHNNEPIVSNDYDLPALWIALVPILVVVTANFLLQKIVIPAWDTAYLGSDKFGNIEINNVKSIWSMIVALLLAVISVIALNWKKFHDVNGTMTKGAMGSMLPTFNTASEVGYGGTIASLGAFLIVKQAVINISPENPLISEVVAVNVLAGITGSASGGLTIALEALGSTYAQMAQQFDINPEWMHRLASMASGGFDSLPHNGAVITLLTICGLSHKQSYKDIFMVSLVIPVVVTAFTVGVLSVLIQ
ncbi:GntP family permease [Marinicella sp. S1101]|uniref:GntP family permease n=1 Tax=Marinicella marina TaxID=2996016 RepID=UPI002260B4EB|nr:GntP family permease [Marinicella marina]MCX7553503.1 GntP family permease [Marinicella marina]MDJ1140127.1 GntP family permease [Marinicella marina]